MASMRDIKRRKTSVQSTQQITKAMKLVSTVKLQRAKNAAERSKVYFNAMFATVSSILSKSANIDHPYLAESGEGAKKAVIVITSNRGLAGGYNSNVTKLVTNDDKFSKDDTVIYAIGKKGKDTLQRKGYTIAGDYTEVINAPLYADAVEICNTLLEAFKAGEIGEIYLAYTVFKNTVSQIPTIIRLLPVDLEAAKDIKDIDESEASAKAIMNFEPAEEEALDLIIPKYVTSLIYGAMIEAVASENGARMQAMDNATSNAEEMIQDLELGYNRARQAHITQELTEIIGGAEALS